MLTLALSLSSLACLTKNDEGTASASAEPQHSDKRASATPVANPGVPAPGPTLNPPPPAPTIPPPLTTTSPPPVTVAAIDYFADATDIPAKIKAKLACSSCRALDINIFPDRAMVEMQDPKAPLEANQFEIRGGLVGAPTPIKFVGDKPTVESMAESSFDLEKDVSWPALAGMVKETNTRLKASSPTATHIHIQRALPFSKDVKVRVFASGERRNGFVDFDATGKVLKVHD